MTKYEVFWSFPHIVRWIPFEMNPKSHLSFLISFSHSLLCFVVYIMLFNSSSKISHHNNIMDIRKLKPKSLPKPKIAQDFLKDPETPKPMEVKRRTVKTLVTKLGSVSERTRVDALCELRLMTKLDAESRPLIAEAGAVPYLAETLYSSSHSSQDNAAATLLNLSISSRATLMSTRGLLDAISHILRLHASTSYASAVQSSAATLHSLLIEDEYRPIIGSKRDIIYSLIDIVKHVGSPTRSVKDALKALFGIALYPLNRKTIIELGGVGTLFSLVMKDLAVGVVEDATAVIAQIAGCEESEEEFRKVSGVGLLVDLLDGATSSSMRIKENSVGALLNLVRCGSEKVGREVREMGLGVGVVEGIADVAENGSGKGKGKAVSLLKVIYGGNGCVVRDERFDSLLNQCSS